MFTIDHSGDPKNWMLNVINACEGEDAEDVVRRLGTTLIFMCAQVSENDMQKAAKIIKMIAKCTEKNCAPPPSIWNHDRGVTH